MTFLALTDDADRPAFAFELLRLAAAQSQPVDSVKFVEGGFDAPSGVVTAFVAATARTNYAAARRLIGSFVGRPATPATVASPNTITASYVQADVASLKTAIDAIRAVLTSAGLTT